MRYYPASIAPRVTQKLPDHLTPGIYKVKLKIVYCRPSDEVALETRLRVAIYVNEKWRFQCFFHAEQDLVVDDSLDYYIEITGSRHMSFYYAVEESQTITEEAPVAEIKKNDTALLLNARDMDKVKYVEVQFDGSSKHYFYKIPVAVECGEGTHSIVVASSVAERRVVLDVLRVLDILPDDLAEIQMSYPVAVIGIDQFMAERDADGDAITLINKMFRRKRFVAAMGTLRSTLADKDLLALGITPESITVEE